MSDYDDGSEQSSRVGGTAKAVAKHAAKKGGKSAAKWIIGLLGIKVVIIGAAVLLVLLVIGAAAGAIAQQSAAATPATAGGDLGDGTWDAGNIIADAVFYNAAAMTAGQIQSFIDGQGCTAAGCLGRATYTWPGASVAWCQPVAAGSGTFATMLSTVSTACGINPQVSLVMIQKESQGLTRVPPAALTGFGCPDTGPGGSANCDAGSAGVWAQTWGMVQAFAHLRVDPSRVNYLEGQTPHQILWNVAESGCGSGPVTVANRATATLYTYTPYQPDAAALAAYPGTGDACSSYGNRNFYRLFTESFGSTGGGKPKPALGGGVNVAVNGVAVTIPDTPAVAAAVRGKVIQAPNAAVAKGLAAGFAELGLPYVWGGSNAAGGGPDNGCARGGGALNSCGSTIGFDCSGLTAYVIVAGGFPPPGDNSSGQRSSGTDIPWGQGLPGDIEGFPGHVAIWLGTISGTDYILEASDVGTPIRIVANFRSDHDPVLHRHWS